MNKFEQVCSNGHQVKRDLPILLEANMLVGVALRSDLSNTLHANRKIQPGLKIPGQTSEELRNKAQVAYKKD